MCGSYSQDVLCVCTSIPEMQEAFVGPCTLDTEYSLQADSDSPQGELLAAGSLDLSYGTVFTQTLTKDPESQGCTRVVHPRRLSMMPCRQRACQREQLQRDELRTCQARVS